MAPTISQLEEIDHIMLVLGRKFQELTKVEDSFKEEDLEEIAKNTIDEQLQDLLRSPRIILAQKMLQRYAKGKMSLIDNIVDAKMGTYSQNFKKMKFSLGNSMSSSTTQSQSEAPSASDDEEDSNHWPPKLPKIKDASLRRQVFTHSSAVQMAEHLTKAEILQTHNERLEFKGDSVLDYIVCGMLYERFPFADEGLMTVRKSSLVCNSTLWELAMAYKLPEKLKTQVSFHDTPNTPPHLRTKLIPDLFEAYVGGLAVDQGLEVVEKWLTKLYAPFLDKIANDKTTKANQENEVDRMAKTELYQKIGSKDQIPEYLTKDVDPPFTVNCVVNGEVIGQGVDHNTKKAGLRAAADALRNRDAIERLSAKRRLEPRSAPVSTDWSESEMKQENPVSEDAAGAKQALYLELGGVKEAKPTYSVVPDAPAVTVQCISLGQILSQATASSKRQATQEAALSALKNHKAIKKIRETLQG